MSKRLVKSKPISVKTSEYQKEWQTKGNYFQIGRLMTWDDWSESIALEDIVKNYLKPLLGEKFEWWLSVYNKPEESADPTYPDGGELPF